MLHVPDEPPSLAPGTSAQDGHERFNGWARWAILGMVILLGLTLAAGALQWETVSFVLDIGWWIVPCAILIGALVERSKLNRARDREKLAGYTTLKDGLANWPDARRDKRLWQLDSKTGEVINFPVRDRTNSQ